MRKVPKFVMTESYILSVKLNGKLTGKYYCRLPNPHFIPQGALPFLTARALGRETSALNKDELTFGSENGKPSNTFEKFVRICLHFPVCISERCLMFKKSHFVKEKEG